MIYNGHMYGHRCGRQDTPINIIHRVGNLKISIKFYKYKYHELMIRNGMWNIYPCRTLANKIRSKTLFSMITDFLCIMWK